MPLPAPHLLAAPSPRLTLLSRDSQSHVSPLPTPRLSALLTSPSGLRQWQPASAAARPDLPRGRRPLAPSWLAGSHERERPCRPVALLSCPYERDGRLKIERHRDLVLFLGGHRPNLQRWRRARRRLPPPPAATSSPRARARHGGTAARRALGTARRPTGCAMGRRLGTSTAAARHGRHGGLSRHDPASGWHGPLCRRAGLARPDGHLYVHIILLIYMGRLFGKIFR